MDVLENLNDLQREAVRYNEGPLLIIAGAGTGKTRVITRKIFYLLEVEKVRPEEILVLVFSNKAVEEVKNRVEEKLKLSSDEMWISTFHSFCNRILRESGIHNGIPKDFKILDRVEQWIFLSKIVKDITFKYFSKLSDPLAIINDFIHFTSRAKDEIVTPEELFNHLKKKESELKKPEKEIPEDEVLKSQEEIKFYREVGELYSLYQKALKDSNYLEYGDLIVSAYQLFKSKPAVLAEYAKGFKYILVDEFQDTNISQIELLKLCSKYCRNICVVGDDDQGIYRFRGASYASFDKFKSYFKDLSEVKLTQNYRSTKNILKIADRVIKHNEKSRYIPDKNLWTENEVGEKIVITTAPDFHYEAKAVVGEIKKLVQNGTDYSDCAILYRAHSHNEKVLQELKIQNIPFDIVSEKGFFEQPEVKDLISYLKVIFDPDNSIDLFRVMSHDKWNIITRDLLKIARYASYKKTPMWNTLKIVRSVGELSEAELKSINELVTVIEELAELKFKEDAETVFRRLLQKTGYILNFINEGDEQKILNVSRFFRFLQNYVQDKEDKSLKGFIEYLDLYLTAEGELDTDRFDETSNRVKLLTVHASKGLQFKNVFIIGLCSRRFPSSGRKNPIELPLGLIKEKIPEGDTHAQEERRLFYVALTRAQKRLFLFAVDKKGTKPSQFIREFLDEDSNDFIEIKRFEAPDEAVERVEIPLEKDEKREYVFKRHIMKLTDDLIKYSDFDSFSAQLKNVWEGFSREKDVEIIPKPEKKKSQTLVLSFTQINTYKTCPLQYRFNYIYQIPKPKHAAPTFGSSIHKTLQKFYKEILKGKIPALDKLLKLYEECWETGGYIDIDHENRYKQNGYDQLSVYYEKNMKEIKPVLGLEQEFYININGHKVKGYIDRIDQLEDIKVEIVDYKTGKPRKSAEVNKDLQLSIYALACIKELGFLPEMLSFYYLETNEKISTVRSPDQLNETEELIRETIDNILNKKFEPNVGYQCKWCDYKWICPAWEKQ